jgi:hypothetical protein
MTNKKNLIENDPKVRIRTKEELKVRRNEFLKICDILDKLNIRYFLQGGLLLGAMRHNDFIPWDWDAELSVFTDEVTPKIDLLINEISLSGFTLHKYVNEISHLKIDFIGMLPKEVTGYTIMAWNHDKEKKIFWRNKFKIPDHFLLNMKKIKLFERYHFVQTPPEKFLEHQYGDWKKPLQTSNKYIYLNKKYSGMNIIVDTLKKIGFLLLSNMIKFYKEIKKKVQSKKL